MATVTQFAFPATEVALAETFDRLSDPRFTMEKSVAAGSGDSCCLWATAPEKEDLQDALAADPSVQQFDLVAEEDRRWLFDVDFWPTVELLRSILLCEEGVITDIVGRDGQWIMTCRYTDHASLSEVSDLLDDRTFRYDVLRIQNDSETASAGAALTDEQYTALRHACKKGYFEVPREATLEELADDLGISHQALSERIRRGVAAYLTSEFQMVDDEQAPEIEAPTP